MIDLISEAVGGRIVECNDDFFAEASNLLKIDDPVWKEHEYTDRGKWMDGWESRRRREPGHDWCVIGLGIPGRIRRVTLDTTHFTGNYPEQFSLEAAGVDVDDFVDQAEWVEIIGRTDLAGDTQAVFDLEPAHRVTHVRLNIYPDGGVARLRVSGDPIPRLETICPEDEAVDLAGLLVGGEVIDSSDSYFSPPNNMLRPADPRGMWDGWETRRRRGPGNDWAVFKLGMAGSLSEAIIDTRFFKGNAPGWVSMSVSDDADSWEQIVDREQVEKDAVNRITLSSSVSARFVKLDIHPDGGVARFRVMGRADRQAAGERGIQYLNSLLPQAARSFLHSACAASKWIGGMETSRPFPDVRSVLDRAGEVFEGLEETDWLEAFAGHPRIGEKSADRVARREQSGAARAEEKTLVEIQTVNAEYEDRFGFTYIVYATGKSGGEMLAIARRRLANSREEEIANAAREQRKITATRLGRMLCQEI